MPIPKEIQNQKYVCLTTFRKSGVGVSTPLWFAEIDGKLYAMTRNDSGKYKRIRNNANVKVAPCTIRGKVIGPEFAGKAQILPRNGGSKRKTLCIANIGWRAYLFGARKMNICKSKLPDELQSF